MMGGLFVCRSSKPADSLWVDRNEKRFGLIMIVLLLVGVLVAVLMVRGLA